MTDDIFNKPVDPPKTDADLFAVYADKLAAIKNADGSPKYTDLDKALDALNASQEHIKRLETEATARQVKEQALTVEAEAAKELRETIRRMSEGNDNNAGKPNSDNLTNTGGLSKEDAAKLVKDILDGERQTNAAVQNVSSVQDKLLAQFGDKARDVVKAKADELGITTEKLKELSATSPQMVLALFGTTSNFTNGNTSTYSLGAKPIVEPEIKLPEKSLLSGSGATTAKQVDLMKQIKAKVYAKNGIDLN